MGNLAWFAILLIIVAFVFTMVLRGETVPVRYREGLVHGFLVLKTLDGETIATGDLTQIARGTRVTTRLLFHFKDGSIHDETADYIQQGTFKLLKDHLVQKGPSFKQAVDTTVDATTGQFVNKNTDDGKEKEVKEKLSLPPDVANGLILTLLKNIQSKTPSTTVSMVAATPKPKLVKLVITPRGTQTFSVGSTKREAVHYVIHVDLKGITGVVAPLVGKEPSDVHVWIAEGDAPAFVRMEGALYNGGPIWRIELATPSWQTSSAENSPRN